MCFSLETVYKTVESPFSYHLVDWMAEAPMLFQRKEVVDCSREKGRVEKVLYVV